MKKITLFFAPNAKETIACTGICPEDQPVQCSTKHNEQMGFTVEVELSERHFENFEDDERLILEADFWPTILKFHPIYLINREAFAEEFFGSLYE